MELIRLFDKLGIHDANIAGGKGASLGEMTQVGIPVPPGFVILANAFERFLEEADLNQELEAILDTVDHQEIHTVEHASEKIRGLITNAKMPEDIAREIAEQFRALGAQYVAVRSSATAEDSSSAAWAGQLDTFLNTTEENLLQNVQKCWASLFTPRAIFYRFEKGMHGSKISVAVVVQKMIQSEVSGIAFSVHPVTEDYNQLIIEAGFGLGEAIVSGQVTPDSFVIEKNPRRIIDRNITYQSRALVRAPAHQEHSNILKNVGMSDSGNVWRELSQEEGSKPALQDEQVLELAELVLKIENHYGFPCDIEWAFEAEQFFITQSRPITTLAQRIQDDAPAQFNAEDYVLHFAASDLPLLFTDTMAQAYDGLGMVLAFSTYGYQEYSHRESLEQTLDEGVTFYGSQDAFRKYLNDLETTFDTAEVTLNEISKSIETKNDAIKFFHSIADVFRLYLKMDPWFVDKAYEQSNTNPILKKNLAVVQKLKDEYRLKINSLFLEDNNFFTIFTQSLSAKFGVPQTDLMSYTMPQIVDLFDGKKVSDIQLQSQRQAYLLDVHTGTLKRFFGTDAEHAMKTLQKQLPSGDVLKGVVANKGKNPMVRGSVRVIDLNYSDFSAMRKQMTEMKKSEILVVLTTGPELMDACNKAAAIVTDVGGILPPLPRGLPRGH